MIPLAVGLNYCVNSGELLDKVPVVQALLPPRCLTRQSATYRIYPSSEYFLFDCKTTYQCLFLHLPRVGTMQLCVSATRMHTRSGYFLVFTYVNVGEMKTFLLYLYKSNYRFAVMHNS